MVELAVAKLPNNVVPVTVRSPVTVVVARAVVLVVVNLVTVVVAKVVVPVVVRLPPIVVSPVTAKFPVVVATVPSSVMIESARAVPAESYLVRVLAVPVALVSSPKVLICAIPALSGVVSVPERVKSEALIVARVVAPETVSEVREAEESVMVPPENVEFVISTLPRESIR